MAPYNPNKDVGKSGLHKKLAFSDDVPVRPQPALITNGPSGTLGMCGLTSLLCSGVSF